MLYIKEYLVNFSVLITIIYLAGFLYKQFLVNSGQKLIEFTLVVIAILAGWCSMFFGIHLNDSVIFDLRFIPIIIATMYSRNPLYILLLEWVLDWQGFLSVLRKLLQLDSLH